MARGTIQAMAGIGVIALLLAGCSPDDGDDGGENSNGSDGGDPVASEMRHWEPCEVLENLQPFTDFMGITKFTSTAEADTPDSAGFGEASLDPDAIICGAGIELPDVSPNTSGTGVLTVKIVPLDDGSPALPWLGIMCLGFGMGGLFLMPRAERIRWFCGRPRRPGCLLRARGINLYGDPSAGPTLADVGRTALSFFNVTKYPPSLLFALATLGPGLPAAGALSTRRRGPVAELFLTYGRVPLFVYVLHIYWSIFSRWRGRRPWAFPPRPSSTPCSATPASAGASAAGVYLIWVLVLALLFPLARWFGALKRRRRDWWLSYLWPVALNQARVGARSGAPGRHRRVDRRR